MKKVGEVKSNLTPAPFRAEKGEDEAAGGFPLSEAERGLRGEVLAGGSC